MRKTASTGRISEYNPHINKMKERFSQRFKKSSLNPKYLKLLQVSNYPIESYSNSKTTKTINSNILLSQNPNQNELYDELMNLKRKVNSLNAQISFAKSQKRKKDIQINTKKKELANYLSDIKMSKDISPINIDKLKDSNMISLLKKEYYKAKNLLNAKKVEAKNLEMYLKKSKPNIEMKKNEDLENQLRIMVAKYCEIQKRNNEDSKRLYLLRNLAQTFNEILRKQNLSKANVNKHIEHLMNQKKNKEEIVKIRAIYEKRIKTLEEELSDLKDKCSKNDKEIDSLKDDLVIIEKFKNEDQLKLKQFNYENLKKIDKDPLENVNSKILLLNSLIEESNKNIKKYKEDIIDMNDRLKDMGYDPFDVDDLLNNENTKVNKEKKDDKNNDELNKDIKENNEEENNQKETEKINNVEETGKDNILIQKNLDSDGKKMRFESTNEGEDTKKDNINKKPETEQNKEIKEDINNNLLINDDNENSNEIKINDNNNNMKIIMNQLNKEFRVIIIMVLF